MEKVIKQVEPVPFYKRLLYPSAGTVGTVGLFVISVSMLFTSNISTGHLAFPVIAVGYMVYSIVVDNRKYLYKISIDQGEVSLDFVDARMNRIERRFDLDEFRSEVLEDGYRFSPNSIRFFSGTFRTDEVFVQPITEHWSLSELKRVHAEIMAVVPPVGQGAGMKSS